MRGVSEANLPRGGNRGAAVLRHRRAVFVARHAPPMDAERNGGGMSGADTVHYLAGPSPIGG